MDKEGFGVSNDEGAPSPEAGRPSLELQGHVGYWVGDCSGEGGARETGAHSAHARDAPAGRPIEGTCVGIDDEPPPPAVPPAPQPRRGDRYY